MAKGHSYSHSKSRSHRGRSKQIKNQGKIFQTQMDEIANSNPAPSLVHGVLTIKGSQPNVINHLNNRIASPDAIMYQPQPPMYPPPQLFQPSPMSMYQPPGEFYPQEVQMMNICPAPPIVVQQPYVTEANITVVGIKKCPSDQCTFTIIVILGTFLIFPLFFLWLTCIKAMIYPKYDLSIDFYRLLGAFIRKEMQCRMLKLTVVDNCFDTKKARALYESLAGTQLTSLTFVNKALDCNFLGTEADDFKGNVSCIKSLPFTSSLTWGSMIA